jgi:hypothetical protein
VVELVAPSFRRVDRDLELGLELLLSYELIQPGWTQCRLGAALVGQRRRRGDFDPAQRALAFQRTGRSPGVSSCLA